MERWMVEEKLHLVKWSIVCLEQSSGVWGGLEVRRFSFLNKVLLCKWNWKCATERATFWTQVISDKYGGRGRVSGGPIKLDMGMELSFENLLG